jgi:choline dehydrogenase-like flavoprotein
MIKDLAREANASASTEVLIIGGGIAGLLLAVKLREHDVPVIVLESGGLGNDHPHPLNEIVHLGRHYRGALEGRARGVGGTSALWGGALLPFLAEDMQARPHAGVAQWPVGLDCVAPYIGEVERLFALDTGALLDRQTRGRAFTGCDALGRYFYDHVSARAADIAIKRPLELNRLAGLRFIGSTMRSLRFELTPAAQRAAGVGSAFGHISFKEMGPGGFGHLRAFLRNLQQTRRIDIHAAAKLALDVPYLVRAAYWRYVNKQLRWPEPAAYELHIVAEQRPRPENRIVLANETDALGVPRAAVDWRIAPGDRATIEAFASRFDAYWKRHNLDRVGGLEWAAAVRDADSRAPFEQIGDVFHPGGTTRMGSSPRHGVVDGNLNTFAIANLWVASTSAFPSGASANPTMMLLLFTMRLADHLVKASR